MGFFSVLQSRWWCVALVGTFPFFRFASDPPCHRKDQLDVLSTASVFFSQLSNATCGVQGASEQDRGGALYPETSLCFQLCAVPSSGGVCGEAWDVTGLHSGAVCPSMSIVFSTSNALKTCVGFLSWSLCLPSFNTWGVLGRCSDEEIRLRRISSHSAPYVCQMSHIQYSSFLSL